MSCSVHSMAFVSTFVPRSVRSLGASALAQRSSVRERGFAARGYSTTAADAVTWREVEKAAHASAGRLVKTPLLESRLLNTMVGGRVLVKAESLQHGGSFKIRGALNKLMQLDEVQRSKGVVAFSSGNFAQGLAFASAQLGIQATVVMPHDAPLPKVERTQAYGAQVVFSKPAHAEENREIAADRLAKSLAAEHGYTLLHPFNDDQVIAGQGTAAWEIALDAKQRGIEHIDSLLVCCGGGGLVSGCSLAIRHHFPMCEVIPIEPDGYDGAGQSLAADAIVQVKETRNTICDSLQAPAPGERPFRILREQCQRGVSVSDDEAANAMKVAFDALKLVLEPGGAVALAAVLEGKVDAKDKVVAVVASGGNVSWPKFCQVMDQVEAR